MANRYERRFALPPDNDGNINYELQLSSKLPNNDPFLVNLYNKFEGYTYTAVVENSALSPNKIHLVLQNEQDSPYFIRVRKVRIVPVISATITSINATFHARGFGQTTTFSGATPVNKFNPHDLDFSNINSVSPTIKLYKDATLSQDQSNLYDSTVVTLEESGTPSKEGILLNHDNDASSLHLNDNLGLLIRQDNYGSEGAVNIFVTFTVDELP